jgi:hypothetical protein
MPGGSKKEKFYLCEKCGFRFSDKDVPKICSNCFACSGCEIYVCPGCGDEVVIKPIKTLQK